MSTTTVSDVFYTGSNANIDSLYWGGAWSTPGPGTTVIEYSLRFGSDPYGYFSGITYGNAWSAIETTAIQNVFSAWEAVANIDFQQTLYYDNAEVWYWQGSDVEVQALGWHEVPDSAGIEPLYGVFSYEGLGWNTSGLQAGGYGYLTLLHEIGHGLGLAHPHDNGGDSSIMAGVSSAFDDFGTYDLNQGVWTVMTYNDGWMTEYPSHTVFNGYDAYGYSATPMALDIATIQELYGANTTYANGDNTYTIPSVNGGGTYWSCIWDTGGYDVISAAGSNRAYTIDLREAPLTGANAGGYMNYSSGIVGGFTIANGVDIEEAIGGSGNDTITGNDNGNTLGGGLGNDSLTGGAGDDVLVGGLGADVINGGAGVDTVDFSASEGRVLADLHIDARNVVYAVFYDEGAAEGDTFANVENLIGGNVADDLRGGDGGNTVWGGNGWDRTYGRAGDDTLYGEAGGDKIYGNAGADVMSGGDDTQQDRFIYFRTSDSGVGAGNRDIITDFDSGEDRIEIRRFDADSTVGGKQYFTFVGDAGLSGVAGELTYLHQGGNTIIQADLNGDAVADFEIELTGIMDLVAGDFFI